MTEQGGVQSLPIVAPALPPPLHGLMRRYVVCLRVVLTATVVSAVVLLIPIWAIPGLRTAVAAVEVGQGDEDQAFEAFALAGLSAGGCILLSVAALIVLFVAFLVAMARARRIAREAGITELNWSYGWTVGSFFIPFLNLYRPWVGLAEIRDSIIYSSRFRQLGDAWKTQDRNSGATIALGIVLYVGNLLSRKIADLPSISDSPTIGELHVWAGSAPTALIIMSAVQLVLAMPVFIYLMTLNQPLRDLVTQAEEASNRRST